MREVKFVQSAFVTVSMLPRQVPTSVADPDIPFRGAERDEMRLNANRTIGSFGGKK